MPSRAALALLLVALAPACGRKGDPVPHPRTEPGVPRVRMADLRSLEVVLPSRDRRGEALVGLEKLRVLYLPVGNVRPGAAEVAGRGEVVLEMRRPDLPAPGQTLRLDLRELNRPPGWLVVVAVRIGDVVGPPSDPLPWLDKQF